VTSAKSTRYARKPPDSDEPVAASACIADRQILPCGTCRMRLTGVIPSSEARGCPTQACASSPVAG
jgi:hypothetical protein